MNRNNLDTTELTGGGSLSLSRMLVLKLMNETEKHVVGRVQSMTSAFLSASLGSRRMESVLSFGPRAFSRGGGITGLIVYSVMSLPEQVLENSVVPIVTPAFQASL